MAVKRIVTNIATNQVDAARAFSGDVLGLELVMDHGWILTFAAAGAIQPPLSFRGREAEPGIHNRDLCQAWRCRRFWIPGSP